MDFAKYWASATSTADLGATIDQSLRFTSDQYLSRTPSSQGNRRKFTYSGWAKTADPAGTDMLFSAFGNASSAAFELYFTNTANGNGMQVYQWNGSYAGTYETNDKFRDVSAWYHVVMAVDTEQSDASKRMRLWVNNREVSYRNVTNFSQNLDTYVNTTQVHRIGNSSYNTTSNRFDGYMAEVHFLDGQYLTPTDFGEYNIDRVWIPLQTSFTTAQYGTNGFYLKFDSSGYNGSGGIGADHSGNGNDFTATGFDTAAISSSNPDNDIDFNDTPTSNYATWNPLDKIPFNGSASISNANLKYVGATTGSVANGFAGSIAINSGKWYWETAIFDTGSGGAPEIMSGIISGSTNSSGFEITDSYKFYFNRTNSLRRKFEGTSFVDYSSFYGTFTTGDVWMIAFDADSGKLWYGKNGSWYSNASGSKDPAAGTNPDSSGIDMTKTWRPGGAAWTSEGSGQINLGQMPFIYTPPTGYSALQTNNLPEPTIKDGKKNFGVLLYNGNGSTQTVNDTDEVDFTPDLVWVKARTGTRNHFAFDCIRGGTKGLLTNDTNSDVTRSTFLSSFDNGGFSVGADGDINANTVATVAWCWKAGGEPTATNSAGAGNVPTADSVKIDGVNKTDALAGANPATKISANTTAGFSIVQYNGTGSQTTVAHGLTQTPEFIIIHNRENNSFKSVYHKDSYVSPTDPGVLYLNRELDRQTDTNVFGTGTFTLDNTVFTVGTYEGSNASAGDEHIAYVWHSVEGFSKFGLFTGNGDADGPFVYLGFRPAFILFKATNNSNNWQLVDTARDPINNGTSTVLRPDEATEESTSLLDHIDILSNGFKIRDGGGFNGNSWQISYAAFAEHPFGGENQPPATAR